MSTIFTVIITLAVLVVFHELGHFIVAKCLGVGVRIFSLGFGPKLVSCTFGETEYRLSLVPFGGYVSFYEPASKNTEASIIKKLQKDRSFDNASVLVRMIIVFAGPLWNFLLAIVICWGLFWCNGIKTVVPEIGYVAVDSPAEQAGILVGDRIIAFNGSDQVFWGDIVNTVQCSIGKPLAITLLRDGKEISLEIVPSQLLKIGKNGTPQAMGHIGLAPTGMQQTIELSLMQAAMHGLGFTWEIIAETGKAFGLLVTGELGSDAVGGPIMISQAISEHAEQGASTLLALIAIISVNLGLVNLLPLPVLDGGHIVMFMIEAVRGRPVSAAMQKNFQRVGLFALLLLIAWGTYNDIMRF